MSSPPPGPGPAGVLVPAAGSGLRLGGGTPKALRELDGTPLLVHALRRLVAARSVAAVVVAAPPQSLAEVTQLAAGFATPVTVVAGGATRQASVAAALRALDPRLGVVLVHDAARCLVPVGLIDAVVGAVLAGHPVVVPGLPVTDTIREVDGAGTAVRTVDRERLRAVQTPQGFARDVLERAHRGPGGATDDAGLAEALGLPVHVIPGAPEAFKVTHPLDLLLAEALVART